MAGSNSLSIQTGIFGRLLTNVSSIELIDDQVLVHSGNRVSQTVDLSTIEALPSCTEGLFGLSCKLVLKSQGKKLVWSFLPTKQTNAFIEALSRALRPVIRKRFIKLSVVLSDKAIKQYLRDSDVQFLHHVFEKQCLDFIENEERYRDLFQPADFDLFKKLASFYPFNKEEVERLRQTYEARRFKTRQSFFDTVESNPLTQQQRLAIIRNNDVNLVLAAAGTGKTSVMVGKALDLLDSGDVTNPEEILILAYNRAAAKELKERLATRAKAIGFPLNETPHISTFHALGRDILNACHRSVHLSVLAQDPQALAKWFDAWFQAFTGKSKQHLQYMLDLACAPVDSFNFKSREEYERYVNEHDFITFNGETVRGYQELLIANWLFMHNVPYEYEAKYVVKKRIEESFDYSPDFHLFNGIYLEHFGIDREGKTRPDIDAQEYNLQMQQKRQLHAEQGTILLETYHYDWVEGKLYERLETLLTEQGIPLREKSEEELLTFLKEKKFYSAAQNTLLSCLQAIRSECLSLEDIQERLKHAKVIPFKPYCIVLKDLKESYEKTLSDADEIDFDDMIVEAISLVESGNYNRRFKHILVDEFQDISQNRFKLLQAIRKRNPGCISTFVGDDWQSIYRFSGGKLEITTRLHEYVGSYTLSKLEKTFRYNNSIADTAGQFVMANPEQFKKSVLTHTQVDRPAVHILDDRRDNSQMSSFGNPVSKALEALNEIRQKDPAASVAVLARYRHLIDEARQKINDNGVKFWTFHGAKGLEADYCILLGFTSGPYGFPSSRVNVPVLESLLPTIDSYPYSEERRLFYVALTRAKKESYIIGDANKPSSFLLELLSSDYKVDVRSKNFNKNYPCQHCSIGSYVLHDGPYGEFYLCSCHPQCRSKARVCKKCGAPSVDRRSYSICLNPKCRTKIPICDRCGRPMKLRHGKYGAFWGCSGYSNPTDSCTFTRPI